MIFYYFTYRGVEFRDGNSNQIHVLNQCDNLQAMDRLRSHVGADV
jgi:hypothetical protein